MSDSLLILSVSFLLLCKVGVMLYLIVLSPHDEYLINKFILARRYPRTLDPDFLGLLCNYLTFGIHQLPLDLRDRLMHECIVLIEHNFKNYSNQRGVLQLCYANFLIQTLVSTSHEYLSRSQVEDLVRRPLDVVCNKPKSDLAEGSSRSAIHTLLFYCPKLTLELMRRRQCLGDYLNTLNKDIRKLCYLASDRSLVILGLISILQNTLGSPEHHQPEGGNDQDVGEINHKNIFKFLIYFLEYHYYLSIESGSLRGQTYSLVEQTRIGNLEKSLAALKLYRMPRDEQTMNVDEPDDPDEEADNPYISRAYDHYHKVTNMKQGLGVVQKSRRDEVQDDGDEEDDEDADSHDDESYSYGHSSLAASEKSFEMNGGYFESNSYKKFGLAWNCPISKLDEFCFFNQFLSVLRRSYDDHFILLTRELPAADKKSLQDSLFTKKVFTVPTSDKPGEKPKTGLRKIYRVKRTIAAGFAASNATAGSSPTKLEGFTISSTMDSEG
jgi:hypothetical protein